MEKFSNYIFFQTEDLSNFLTIQMIIFINYKSSIPISKIMRWVVYTFSFSISSEKEVRDTPRKLRFPTKCLVVCACYTLYRARRINFFSSVHSPFWNASIASTLNIAPFSKIVAPKMFPTTQGGNPLSITPHCKSQTMPTVPIWYCYCLYLLHIFFSSTLLVAVPTVIM